MISDAEGYDLALSVSTREYAEMSCASVWTSLVFCLFQEKKNINSDSQTLTDNLHPHVNKTDVLLWKLVEFLFSFYVFLLLNHQTDRHLNKSTQHCSKQNIRKYMLNLRGFKLTSKAAPNH